MRESDFVLFSKNLKQWLFVPIFFKYCLSLRKATDKIVFHEQEIDDRLRLRRIIQPQRTDLLSRCESIVLYDLYDRAGEGRSRTEGAVGSDLFSFSPARGRSSALA